MTGPDETTAAPRDSQDLRSALSHAIVREMKEYYGKGPEFAKSYLMDDLLFVVMREATTVAEKTMVAAGQANAVRDFRQEFENEMADRLRGVVERLTGRKVVNYQSQILFDPDMLIEVFVFAEPLGDD